MRSASRRWTAALLLSLAGCGGGNRTTIPTAVVPPSLAPSPTPVPTPIATPTPVPLPTPTPPEVKTDVQFISTSCDCVTGSIHLKVDATQVGTMACKQSRTIAVSPGEHDLSAHDERGTWGPITVKIPRGTTLRLDLDCRFRMAGAP